MCGLDAVKLDTVKIMTGRPYDVIIGDGVLSSIGELLPGQRQCVAALVADDIVDRLYGNIVTDALQENGYTVYRFVFPHGEENKNMTQLANLLSFLAKTHLSRSDIIVALGGGVTGDLAGFAAAIYLRGIDYIQIPTTFLAAIDSSVGGKTAVDLPEGKNQVGAFWQPLAVVCDTATFATLPKDVFIDGTAEAIKYGVLADQQLFFLLAGAEFNDQLKMIIRRCVEIKGDFVHADERDTGARQLLNLGHTVGHAIEQCSGYAIPHGHAVATGMAVIAKAAAAAGICQEQVAQSIEQALVNNNLPVHCTYPLEKLVEVIATDKKRRGDTISLVVPEQLGKCRLHDLNLAALASFIAPGLK